MRRSARADAQSEVWLGTELVLTLQAIHAAVSQLETLCLKSDLEEHWRRERADLQTVRLWAKRDRYGSSSGRVFPRKLGKFQLY